MPVHTIGTRAIALREANLAALRAQHPALFPKPAIVVDRSAIVLGRDQAGSTVFLPERPRLEHAHVIGTTGGGKSKFLQMAIRQDIIAGRGVCYVDPHGSHPDSEFRELMCWLDERGYTRSRTIHVIDPEANQVVGFNPLARPDPDTDLSVIAGVTLEAFSRAWGGEDTSQKPTIERIITATFTALAELGLTLVEAPLLYDRDDPHGLRAWAAHEVRDPYARKELQRLHELSLDERRRHDFDVEVVGPINRIARFVRPEAIRAMVGQTQKQLDIRQAMDEGHIILVNLSGGSRIYERDADLLGRLLTRFIFFHAKRRRRPDRPFFFYLDECHRYLTGDLENILAEVRKYGIGVTLAHQWLAQMSVESENMLAAVRNATNIKAVFRLKDPAEAEDLAHMVVPLDLEMPVRVLVKPTVVGQRIRLMNGRQRSEQRSITETETETVGQSTTVSVGVTEGIAETVGESETDTVTVGSSRAKGWSTSESCSQGESVSSAEGWSETGGASWNTDRSSTRSSGSSKGADRSAQATAQAWPREGLRRAELPFRYFQDATLTGVSRGQSRQTSEERSTSLSSGQSRSEAAGHSGSRTTGRSASKSFGSGRSFQETESKSRSHGHTTSWSTTHSSSTTHGIAEAESRSLARGIGKASGTSQGSSEQESFESVYQNLPSAVHGKENVLYMAATTLRNLTTGTAFISFVDKTGMKSALVTVPRIRSRQLTAQSFDILRARLLARSTSSSPLSVARERIAERETALIAAAQSHKALPEPENATGFRSKRKRALETAENAVEPHGQQSAPKRTPVKGPDRRRRRP